MEIVFYDFDFTRRYILYGGLISVNAKQELQASAKFQIVFHDKELEEVVRSRPDGMLVSIEKYWGVLQDYNFKDDKSTLYGEHLNVLLCKSVIAAQTFSGNAKDIVSGIISEYYPFLTFTDDNDDYPEIEYELKEYKSGDSVIKQLCTMACIGYEVYAEGRTLKFRLIKPKETSLMLSESNLNAYDFAEDYDGKTIAYGGWYKPDTEDSEWTYIERESRTGIQKQDIVLTAKTEEDAIRELDGKTAAESLTCTVHNIEYLTDYRLGDIVRLQKTTTVRRTVTGIELRAESGSYKEIPVFSELEEVTNG